MHSRGKHSVFRLDSWVLVVTAAALVIGVALFRAWSWDATAYHLPFAARQLDLSKYRNISPLINERYQGFPVLWRYALAPGLIFENPRLDIIPNLIGAFTAGAVLRKLLHVNLFLGIAATLCFPIAYLGFASNYADYFTNCFVLAGALLLSHWMFFFCRKMEHQKTGSLITGLAFLAIASNTKVQGFFLSVIILAATVAYGWLLGIVTPEQDHADVTSDTPPSPRTERPKWWSLRLNQLVIAIILTTLIFIQPIVNFTRFQNPFYPIHTLGFKGPQAQYSTPLEYLPRIPLLSNALSHYLSASEVDPYLLPGGTNIPPQTRSLGMYSNTREIRTGGSLGIVYLALLFIFALNTWKVLRSGIITTHAQSLSIFLPLVSVATAILPQSLELRYYMVSLFVISVGSLVNPLNNYLRKAARIIILIGVIASVYHLGLYGRGLIETDQRFNLKAELPTSTECIQKGRLVSMGRNQFRLILDPKTVPNNIPFLCRLVMPESIFIDYTVNTPGEAGH